MCMPGTPQLTPIPSQPSAMPPSPRFTRGPLSAWDDDDSAPAAASVAACHSSAIQCPACMLRLPSPHPQLPCRHPRPASSLDAHDEHSLDAHECPVFIDECLAFITITAMPSTQTCSAPTARRVCFESHISLSFPDPPTSQRWTHHKATAGGDHPSQ
mmetsp:Transcript_37350/g.76631  ORF Transcript_37350/g.76631 Transcript_37350/m.76631 type:complete len:157 (+) Transcript_37350:196-666(+)